MALKRSSEGPLTPAKQAKLIAGIPVTLGLSGQVVATADTGLSPSAASLSFAPPTIPSLLSLSSTPSLRPSLTSTPSSVYLPLNLTSAPTGAGGGAFPPSTPTGLAPMHLISPPPYPSNSVGDGYLSPSQFLCSPTAFKPPDILASGIEHCYDPGLAGFNTEDPESLHGEKLRRYLVQKVIASLGELKARYSDYLKEKFFLLNSGAMVDLLLWKKKPNVHLAEYLTAHRLDEGELEREAPTTAATTVAGGDRPSQGRGLSNEAPLLQFGSASALAAASSTGATQGAIGLASNQRSVIVPPTSRITTRIRSFTTVYDKSHEDIVLRARHEAEVMKAISELRREGLWSASRLPKVMEPVRRKTHWDYLLEEMQWLATDFANERRWKRGAARKMVRSVLRHHQEVNTRKEQQGKEQRLRLKKIANSIAKEIKQFWDSINRLAEHKQQMVLEAKCKKALDMHLSFIVDQTEKYSTWLVKDFADKPNTAGLDGDEMFIPQEASEDEEETIEREEKEAGDLDYSEEVAALERESMLPIEELLASLPQEMLGGAAEEPPEEERAVEAEDTEFKMEEAEDVEDEEGTIEEQEDMEGGMDHNAELEELQQEGDLSMEELMAKYGYVSQEVEEDVSDSVDGESTVCSGDEGEEGEDLSQMVEPEEDSALHMLVSGKNFDETEPGLTDIAAQAERLQPKGTSLATTEVRTPVPFLLRHKLRDYQHIGLDWLVMMHERKLNGILADEMGLGKTIQTIALLAHVACERGVWGPHLIVVPTSVLLNWEFEFKKWCPAFKILTYFGSTKERKQLRVGWTKPNAFHVCITSYNLAVKDHRAFKQKKWRYLVLDEAQNIKNFKSQRWQTLLSFNSQRRLLLTGTPLQNSVMELWSLMHFLMPSVFSSHTDFKEWFSNPLTGMVEGSQEYNETIIRRLHKVLRPFLLRRLKSEVEKQMPKKFEHTVVCRLSTRQRFLYEEYMSRAKTKETLSTGNFLSVINILMQLRKVCNHPDLFEPRPIVSPFAAAGIVYTTASIVLTALQEDVFGRVGLDFLNLRLVDYEQSMDAFAGYRVHRLQPSSSSLKEVCLQRPSQTEGETTATSSLVEELRLPEVEARLEEGRRSIVESIVRANSWRCQREPIYGKDLHKAFTIAMRATIDERRKTQSSWLWCGRDACQQAVAGDVWDQFTHSLLGAVKSVQQRALECEDLLSRFIMTTPTVVSPVIDLHICHPPPLWQQNKGKMEVVLRSGLTQSCELLHPVATRRCFQFPETRLIQYDCGKLQTLDQLLSQLKAGNHRVLIFTQMARMLNVLEIFLNYHGYTYLRLDGSTPVQRRQMLMERFNRDERVFCFILSTRSGGLGVNLTGADTVVFYDSDWNPTMDAQAQDRCHRIGQTRDVHIYRLVCEGTVEENVLKKANQKRRLGELAIESGAFTTEFFTEGNIRELFSGEERAPSAAAEVPSEMAEAGKEELQEKEVTEVPPDKSIEVMLAEVEDESDVKAASRAKQEQVAELAEFDEGFMDAAGPLGKDPEESKVATELAALEVQLSGVEKFALRYVETQNAAKHAEQLRMAERDIEQAKKNWELGHLQSLKEEEERLAEEEFNNVILTYDRPEAVGKVYLDDETLEEMPIWYPPTPPIDDNDMYLEYALDMWYDLTGPMEEALLPPIDTSMDYDVFGLLSHKGYLKGNKKSLLKSQHKKSKDRVTVNSTLFWKRTQAESLAARLKKMAVIPTKKVKSKDQLIPLVDTTQERVDWSVVEDWIVLRTITHIHELNIHLTIVSPAQIPNFHMISDLVTAYGKTVRSTQQCRDHFISVIHPREESKQQEETEVKKIRQKDGTIRKVKVSKSHRTKGLVVSDGGVDITRHYTDVFDTLVDIGKKKSQPPKFMESTSTGVSHLAILLEYGIKYDDPHSPSVLSLQRAERIQAEKTAELSKQTQMMNQQLLGPTAYGAAQVGTTSTPTPAALKGAYPPASVAVSNSGWSAAPGQVQAPPSRSVGPLSWKPTQAHVATSASSVGSAIPRASFATHLALSAKMQSLQAAQPQPMDTDGTRTVRKLSSEQPPSHQESSLPAALVPTPLTSHMSLSGLSQASRTLTSAPVSLVAKGPTTTPEGATHVVQPQLTPQQQMLLMQRLQQQHLIKAQQAKRMTQLQHAPGGGPHSATKGGLTPSAATSNLVTTLAKQRNVTEDVIALLKQHQQQQMQQQQGQARTVSLTTPSFSLGTAQQQLALQKQIQSRQAAESALSPSTSAAPPLPSPTMRALGGLPSSTTVAPLSSLIMGQSSTTEQGSINMQAILDSQGQLASQPTTPSVILSPQGAAKLTATTPLIQAGQSVTQTFKLQQGATGKALTQVTTSAYPATTSQNKPAAQGIQQAHFTLNQLLRAQLEAVSHHVAQQQQQQQQASQGNSSPTQVQTVVPIAGTATPTSQPLPQPLPTQTTITLPTPSPTAGEPKAPVKDTH